MYIFNSKFEKAAKLEQMLVGRKPVVDMLEEAAKETAKSGTLFQNLIVGPRGSGKTHLLKVLYNRLTKNEKVKKKLVIAYMSEDEVGIDSFLDFLIRIFAAFKRWIDDEKSIALLEQKIEELKITGEYDRDNKAQRLLLEFLDKKDLLILIENLDNVFAGLKKNGQAKLRDFIQQHTNVSFIATTQALFNDLKNEDKSFFNFFNITYLKKLTLEESTELIEKLAELENQTELLLALKEAKWRGNIKAIYELTGGNHRLMVLFYDFLKTDYKAELSESFLKTLDKLKPYYESFLKLLTPQQQKIIHYLSLKRIPQTGKSIAQNCFIGTNIISKQLSELQRLGYVSSNKVGKEGYYEINEPLLRFCFEINEDRNGIIKLFVDFLGYIYSSEELIEKYLKFKYLAEFQPAGIVDKFIKESELYTLAKNTIIPKWKLTKKSEKRLTSCKTKEEREKVINEIAIEKKISESHRLIDEAVKCNDNLRVIDLANKYLAINDKDEYLWFFKGASHIELQNYDLAIESFENFNKISPANDLAWHLLGLSYYLKSDNVNAEVCLEKSLNIKTSYESTFAMASLYLKLKQYDKAISYYKKSIKLEPNNYLSLIGWGQANYEIGHLKEAINLFNKSLDRFKNSKEEFREIMFNILLTHYEHKNIHLAIELINKSYGKDNDRFRMLAGIFMKFFQLDTLDSIEFSIIETVKNIEKSYQDSMKFIIVLFLNVITSTLLDNNGFNLERLKEIQKIFHKLFDNKLEMNLVLKFLDIGIRYLKNNEQTAIYEFSKEERNLFNKLVLDRIND